jgi:hypothetical protein
MGHLTNVQRLELLPYLLSRDAKRFFGRRGRALASLTTQKAGQWFFGRRGRVLAPPLSKRRSEELDEIADVVI